MGTWGEAYLTRLRGCAVRMERELVEISDRDRAVRLIESEARTVEEGFGEGLLAMESASRVRTLDPLQSSAWLVAGDPARTRWESLPQLAAYVELLQAGYPEARPAVRDLRQRAGPRPGRGQRRRPGPAPRRRPRGAVGARQARGPGADLRGRRRPLDARGPGSGGEAARLPAVEHAGAVPLAGRGRRPAAVPGAVRPHHQADPGAGAADARGPVAVRLRAGPRRGSPSSRRRPSPADRCRKSKTPASVSGHLRALHRIMHAGRPVVARIAPDRRRFCQTSVNEPC